MKLNENLVLTGGITAEQKKALFESWAPHINVVKQFQPNVPDSELVNLAVCLESTKREAARTLAKVRRSSLTEATQVSDIQGFKRFAFELITGVLPNLVANEIVSVQALKQKVGQIFYMQYTYGSAKGDIAAGDVMFDPFTTAPGNTKYTSEVVDQEILAAAGAVSTAYLAWKPIRPATIVLTGTVGGVAKTYRDKDGDFKLYDVNSQVGTVDYTTGLVTFTNPITFQTDLEAAYEYNLEFAPAEAPELNLEIKEWLVTARSRKLRARYAFDAAYDIQQQHGIDIETELADTAVAEIRHEIDLEIINDLYNSATLTSSWNMAKPVGVSQNEHYQSFVNEIIAASNKIFQETRRAAGNFVIVGKLAADVLEALPDTLYKAQDAIDAVGPHVAGTLKSRWKVIKNPYFAQDTYLVGYKGKSFIDAGYVYAPYLPVFATQMIMLDDFLGRQGFATSYAKKLINVKYYVKGLITNTAEIIHNEVVS